MSYLSITETMIERRRSPLDRTAEIGAYRFGLLRWLTSLARWQVQSRHLPMLLCWIWARLVLDRPSPSRSGPRLIFFRNCSVIFGLPTKFKN
jgi:hypothetical protein